MVRRRILNGVAAGLASTFVSRNHDIDGYWGLGKLYSMAASVGEGSPTVVLDLRAGDGIPKHDLCRDAAASYARRLEQICQGYGVDPTLVRAEIRVRFDCLTDRHRREPQGASGEPYECRVTLRDASGREATAVVVGWCREHSMDLERRSTRHRALEPVRQDAAAVPSAEDSVSGLYSPDRVRALFDEMASTYGIVNLISSLGFARRWRRQCLSLLHVQEGDVVADLMSGMGELWPSLARHVGGHGKILGLDLSPAMCAGAERNRRRAKGTQIRVLIEDVLSSSIQSGSIDAVISTFGLKTFSPEQLAGLASEVRRILKPGGQFAFLEISVPPGRVLRWLYMAYLRKGIPLIGQLCLGNPDNYRCLGAYTDGFRNSSVFENCLGAEGMTVHPRSFFFGCATGVVGQKPV